MTATGSSKSDSPQSLEKFWREAFELGQNADLEIHADGDSFKVMKSMLFMQSDVFKAMFEHDTEEKRTNIVKVGEFSAELVEKFLLYFYIRKVDGLKQIAPKMYKLANFYQVKGLEELCLKTMCSHLDTSNILDYFNFANKFDLTTLKQECIEFALLSVNFETMFDFYKLAKENNLDALMDEVITFIRTDVKTVAKSVEWRKFDAEFKVKILQGFVVNLPDCKKCGKDDKKLRDYIIRQIRKKWRHII